MPHTFMYIYIHIHRYTQIYMSVPRSLIMISVYSKLFHQFALTNTKHGPRMLGILHNGMQSETANSTLGTNLILKT